MRVLVSAYACARDAGSEPEIGYTTVLAAARAGHDVTVLTWAGAAAKLRHDLAGDGAGHVQVQAVRGLHLLDGRIGRLGLGHVHYLAWQLRVSRLVCRLDGSFDVAHHVTFGADWMPSGLHRLRRSPVVWGPVGGFAPPPWWMAPHLSGRGMLQEAVREVTTRVGRRLTLRFVRGSRCLVVAHNDHTAQWYRRRGVAVKTCPLVAMPPVIGDDPVPCSDHDVSPCDRSRKVVFVGRLTPWKGCLLAVRTLAELPDNWTLDMYGAGRAGRRVDLLASRLGVAADVRRLGQRPKDEIWSALRKADALLLPSVHDSAPQPVAQAIRSGCPVVCLQSAGPPILAAERGVAVQLGRRLPARLAAALEVAQRFPPDDRWTSTRLPSVITDLYEHAISLPQAQHRSTRSR